MLFSKPNFSTISLQTLSNSSSSISPNIHLFKYSIISHFLTLLCALRSKCHAHSLRCTLGNTLLITFLIVRSTSVITEQGVFPFIESKTVPTTTHMFVWSHSLQFGQQKWQFDYDGWHSKKQQRDIGPYFSYKLHQMPKHPQTLDSS